MAKREGKAELVEVKALLGADPDYLRTMVPSMVQAALEAEMTDFLGASRSERTGERRGYRSGYYERRLITRVGTLELRRIGRVSSRPKCSSATSGRRRR